MKALNNIFKRAGDDPRAIVLAEGEERTVDESITRQRSFDPDLWVIEVEDRTGRHLLDEPGVDT